MISANRCQATMLCHSVRSCHSPPLSLNLSLVAGLNLTTGTPEGVYLISGSVPRFPIRITLLMLFAIFFFLFPLPVHQSPDWEHSSLSPGPRILSCCRRACHLTR